MSVAGEDLRREIEEQPEALARLIARARSEISPLAAHIRQRQPRTVFIAARGSSDNAARYAQYVFGIQQRWAVGLATPSLSSLYEAQPDLSSSLVLGISQSGESPDVVSVLQSARAQGAVTVALTNVESSPLARAAEHCIALHAGPELAVAATKTYTAALTALALLSALLLDDEARMSELERIPEQVREVLKLAPHTRSVVAEIASAERLAVLGRGFQLASAFELALKIKETSYVTAEGYSTADFRHGPAALLQPGYVALLIATQGRALASTLELLDSLQRARARVVLFSDLEAGELCAPADPHSSTLASYPRIALPRGVPEWLAPITTAVAGQVFALELALARGLDPDHPRHLAKVTLTT